MGGRQMLHSQQHQHHLMRPYLLPFHFTSWTPTHALIPNTQWLRHSEVCMSLLMLAVGQGLLLMALRKAYWLYL